MSRLPETTPDRYEPHFGVDAPERLRVWAHAPYAAAQVDQLALVLARHSVLPVRLVELVRLRVAFHNQCRTCMASRYADAREAGVTEELVCSLERPYEAPDLTDDERVALAFADRFATDHLSVTDEQFADLRRHFSDDQVMELCFRLAYLVGFGRMMAILDVRPAELPERFRVDGPMTPWGDGGVMERPAPPVGATAGLT
jgi:AhpD family alkylhydroperoxidase